MAGCEDSVPGRVEVRSIAVWPLPREDAPQFPRRAFILRTLPSPRVGARKRIGGLSGRLRLWIEGDDGDLMLEVDGSAAPVIAWLVGQGVELEEVRREHATFEEAFLDLVDPDGRGEGAR